MGRMFVGLTAAWLVVAGALPAALAAPRVAADIAPVHSLVARVMEGVAEPALLVEPTRSPHHGSLKPSTARALAEAAVVFRVSPSLTPWLSDAVARLAPGAVVVDLLALPGTMRLHRRDAAAFAAHAHGAHGSGHGHGGDHEDMAPDMADPHAWLAPSNARVWLSAIAARLAEADPDNAARYRENARTARDALARLTPRLEARLAPVRDVPFVVMHDAFHYAEHSFGLRAVGAATDTEATEPGPRRVAAMRSRLRESGAACVFVEPQGARGLAKTLVEGTDARVAVLDPLGATHSPGPGLYAAVLEDLVGAMAACLGRDG